MKTRSLAPGQSYVATFTLATHDLAFYNREQQFVAEAGEGLKGLLAAHMKPRNIERIDEVSAFS